MPFPLIFLIPLFRAIVSRIRESRKSAEPVCASCSWAHAQWGKNGRKAIFCTYGHVVRPVQFEVWYCTDYRDRAACTRSLRVGFVQIAAVKPASLN